MMYITPDHPMLQYSGRIDFEDKKAPVFIYAASYVKIRFHGTSVKAVISNNRAYWNNYLGVIVDGIQTKIALKEDEQLHTYILAEHLADDEHELILFKRQDICHMFTLYGLELDRNAIIIEPSLKPERRIEVFGDSVSCGEVSEAVQYVGKEDPEHNGEYSNSWYSYSWMTARKLHAELHDTSQGGIALLDHTGWFVDPHFYGVESCYDKLEYNPEMGPVKPWDFAEYTPHVVIVAIGQNDNHPEDYMAEDYDGAKAENWRVHYKAFVERLMGLYPKAQIILQTTLLQHDANWDRAIDEVCGQIQDPRVHHYMYKRNGAGTPGHLRIPEAEEMAEELTAYIESLGDGIWNE